MERMDESRRAAVCRALAGLAGLAYMWGEEGPTEEGADILEAREMPLSEEERILLEAIWAIWEDNPGPTFSELLALESEKLKTVGKLLVAMADGHNAVDSWLNLHHRR